MIRILRCTGGLVLALLTSSLNAAAQDRQPASATTRLIPYAAVLPDAGPDAIAGARSISFALFDEAEGGTLLWTETQTVNVDARGRYSAYLGAAAALPLAIFRTERARWLEVAVDGKALPRTMLVAVPYALRAADAETLGGTPASGFVRTDANGRRVGADGTTIDDPLVDGSGIPNVLAPDPTGGGVVDARFTIRNPDNNTAIAVLNTLNQRRFALNTNLDGSWSMFDGGSSTWNLGLRQRNGNVGLGSAPPITIKFQVSQNTAASALRATFPNGTLTIQGLSSSSAPGFSGNAGVLGYQDTTGTGVSGLGAGNASGVFGTSDNGLAGNFEGNVTVSGTLMKGGGAFQIDHPIDPENKYLRHSFVESPDMMNVYNGNVTLDANGEAWVMLPEWFEALNRDFRYQLTSIGRQANPYVAEEIAGNRFKIAGGASNGKVSWQVTGIRQDAWANANRIVVEEEKKAEDRGFYLHPKSRGLDGAALVPSIRKHIPVKQSR